MALGLRVRGPRQGDGPALSALWRELWDVHESWGGYPGSQDAAVYAEVARRLDEDARIRMGEPVLGRHIHLVCERQGRVVGQVEGWFDRHGGDETTPYTCEVRSLVVDPGGRTSGAGRELLRALGHHALAMARAPLVVLAAEVVDVNPAQAFYRKLGYVPVSCNFAADADALAALPESPNVRARIAGPKDAMPIAALEAVLAHRRRQQRDLRFDRPRAIDASLVSIIAAHLSKVMQPQDPVDLVAVDAEGDVRAAATLVVASLDPPFIPAKRGLLGRIAIDPARPPGPYLRELARTAARLSIYRGARRMELTDIDAPGEPLHTAALALGARLWSRVEQRTIRESV